MYRQRSRLVTIAIVDELGYSTMIKQDSLLMLAVAHGVSFRCSRVSSYQPGRYIQRGLPHSDSGTWYKLVLSKFTVEDG